MKITSSLFQAYIKCPTKCWLRFTGEPPTGNVYAEWVQSQNESYRTASIERLRSEGPQDQGVIAPAQENLETSKWRTGFDIVVTSQNLEARLHAVERVPPEGRGQSAHLIPTRFVYTNKLGKDEKLLLAFDAFVLSEILGCGIGLGKITHGDNPATLKVKTLSLAGEVRKRLDRIATLLSNPTSPDLVLNRHCAECEFQARCRQKAIEKDDLSLLATMSEKERKKLHAKGLFTVTQLSYTFRPRRRPRRLRDKRERYYQSLKALAIREKKIHIVGSPELKIEGTPVYLDVEGLPDRDFYYLIGIRIGNGESAVQHSLWADAVEEEGKIWGEFLAIVETIKNPVLIHYGSYETDFIKRMRTRYGTRYQNSSESKDIGSFLNLLSFIYAQIYFPSFSTGLKDIAGFFGFTWTDADFTGLQSIVSRSRWEDSHDHTIKERLVNYNTQDCQALELVTQTLSIALDQKTQGLLSENLQLQVTRADDLPSIKSKWRKFTSPVAAFEAINKAAQWDYQRDRIYVRTEKGFRATASKRKRHVKRPITIDRDVICENPHRCPRCGKRDKRLLYTRTRVLLDIRFLRCGLRRWVVRYHYSCFYCRRCHLSFGMPAEFWQRTQYGRDLVALLNFRIIELYDPQTRLAIDMNRFFGFNFDKGELNLLKARAAKYYTETRNSIVSAVLNGSLVHGDETRVVLHSRKTAYVWVLTTLREVAFFYSESREGEFIQRLLNGFQGVLVSDFYAAYDSIPCPQQKCLIHLMRDMNDAFMDYPYDEELRLFVTSFGVLLREIVATIDRWGLKSRFLRKHQADVERFYRQVVSRDYVGEPALKCKERFVKNRDCLFTFLNFNGVPWNNNNAEHAIKAFATLRRKIGAMSTPQGIEDYLILLSVGQTCKYIGVDFLDFLRSGEKDIHAFAESRAGRRRRPRANPLTGLPAEPQSAISGVQG